MVAAPRSFSQLPHVLHRHSMPRHPPESLSSLGLLLIAFRRSRESSGAPHQNRLNSWIRHLIHHDGRNVHRNEVTQLLKIACGAARGHAGRDRPCLRAGPGPRCVGSRMYGSIVDARAHAQWFTLEAASPARVIALRHAASRSKAIPLERR